MPDLKVCPKCSGKMTPGFLKEIGHYGSSPYIWAPKDEAPFAVKGAPSSRRDVHLFRCDQCGYLELYAP
jgi:hypothetical protein